MLTNDPIVGLVILCLIAGVCWLIAEAAFGDKKKDEED